MNCVQKKRLTSLSHSFGILLVEIMEIHQFPKRQLEKQLESRG